MPQQGPILVVEDDPTIRSTVCQILDEEGYSVEAASDGAAALEAVDRERPSLVILDMRMPVLDGWGFAAALRAKSIAVPIVVMTAARDARVWADEISAAGYLAKPFELEDLLATVSRYRQAV